MRIQGLVSSRLGQAAWRLGCPRLRAPCFTRSACWHEAWASSSFFTLSSAHRLQISNFLSNLCFIRGRKICSPSESHQCHFQSIVPMHRENKGLFATAKLNLLVGFVLLLTGAIVARAWSLHEPSYGGKKLRRWVQDLTNPNPKVQETAADAVHHIGVSAVPWLIKWVKPPAQPSRFRKKLETFIEKRLRINIHARTEPEPSDVEAAMAFKILGPVAKSAIPELKTL